MPEPQKPVQRRLQVQGRPPFIQVALLVCPDTGRERYTAPPDTGGEDGGGKNMLSQQKFIHDRLISHMRIGIFQKPENGFPCFLAFFYAQKDIVCQPVMKSAGLQYQAAVLL